MATFGKFMDEKRKEELLAILITTDGKGKDAKREALKELMEAIYEQGWSDGYNDS
jgi:hypothetical protein